MEAKYMKRKIDLSIIIVSFNTKDLLRACLGSIHRSKRSTYDWEIIVIDNASIDQSANMVEREFPDVLVKRLKENVGFASGNNVGIRLANSRYILLLNSDTEVYVDTITKMIQFMDNHPHAGASGCKLILPDGSMDPACHRGFPTPWASLTYFIGLEKLFPRSKLFGQYHEGYRDLQSPHEIDSVSGAFFMVRRDVVDQVGLLDEAYFMYGEDIDWAYRIKKAGWKILFNPDTSVMHRKKQSGREHPRRDIRRQSNTYFFESMKIFYKKHYQHRYGWLTTQIVLFAIELQSKWLSL